MRGPWHEHFQEAIDDHPHAYCDAHDLETFDELADEIGPRWVPTLNDGAMNDFLSRETKDRKLAGQCKRCLRLSMDMAGVEFV